MIDRSEPQVFHIPDLSETRPREPAFGAHARVRTVSRSADDGACTLRLDLGRGWSQTVSLDGVLELFVLEGTITVGTSELSAGGYAYLPQKRAVACASAAGATVLVFWQPLPTLSVTDPIALSSWELRWESTVLPGFPIGGMHKSLRPGDSSGGAAHGGSDGFLRLVLVLPGWFSPMQERHVDCWEENILLRGDMLMPERGSLKAGDCLANPEGLWHGPMTTKGGALFIVNCDAPMGVEYRDYPPGDGELRQYLATAPWA